MPLNYKVLGEGEPIVILHGLFGMLDNWLSVAKVFAEKYTVFLVDLRNHGRSFHSDEWDVPIMADDVLQFLEEHWIYHPIIIGHSMGGKVAMHLALHDGGFIEKLIVVDISLKAYERGHNRVFEAMHSINPEQILNRTDAEDRLSQYLEEKSVRQFLLKNLKRKKEGGFMWKMNLPIIFKNYEFILEQIEADHSFDNPSLFIKGESSHYIQYDDMELNQQFFPNAELLTIPDTGHWVHADKPDVFIEEVLKWIEKAN